MFVAKRASPGAEFEEPKVIGAIATVQDEEPSWISPDECELWFHAARQGSLRIFRAFRQ